MKQWSAVDTLLEMCNTEETGNTYKSDKLNDRETLIKGYI